MYDVRQEQYATVIREMIRHENDVTNHRIMWLLVVQGFLANAFVVAERGSEGALFLLSLVGILVTLSAFLMLYKSYQARGYLEFLGQQAKQGTLQEAHLPLVGWPRKRIEGWWLDVWVSPWIGQTGDILEPWMFLPCLFMIMWMTILLRQQTRLGTEIDLILAAIISAVIIAVVCLVLVWSQGKDEKRTQDSRTDDDRDPDE